MSDEDLELGEIDFYADDFEEFEPTTTTTTTEAIPSPPSE